MRDLCEEVSGSIVGALGTGNAKQTAHDSWYKKSSHRQHPPTCAVRGRTLYNDTHYFYYRVLLQTKQCMPHGNNHLPRFELKRNDEHNTIDVLHVPQSASFDLLGSMIDNRTGPS